MLRLYQLLTRSLAPLISIYLLKRMRRGKEDPVRFSERFGKTGVERPDGKLVWVHAASVGESISVLPIITKLVEPNGDINFLLTTGTTSSARIVAERLPARTIHQYVPIDTLDAVTNFLSHWKPDLALWVESELWPNLVTQASKICPMLLLNGRMSERSYNKWQRHKSLSNMILSCFSLILAQSKHDAERFEKLGSNNVKYIGNIKYDAPPLPDDEEKRRSLEVMIGSRPIWLASSTHNGEEELIAEAHKKLKEQYPQILTIIAPRHPARSAEIIRTLYDMGMSISLRSIDDEITDRTDIYLADTMGELGIFYRLAKIVFIGGTLVQWGGQNPLEPARLGCSIVHGPHMDNFAEIESELAQHNAAIIVQDSNTLANAVASLIGDEHKRNYIALAALKVVREKNGVLDAYVSAIGQYLR
ncbi:MAG: 3-deoxy-D-manno-octulosonic acid transferase [Rickettsiaceae bacterium]|jgi:3-deoxy-D-manno-octulosonic-acid transferase|nr:3-deoxy-D-manno-octulosonic acid transferase [Rickettsiaceae bacterium]